MKQITEKERNDGKDMTDTDLSVPAASAEKAEDFLLPYRNEIRS